MKKIISLLKFTAMLLVLLVVLYPSLIWGIAQFSDNNGEGSLIKQNGKIVGYREIGQKFDKPSYFWGRPSAVDYNAAGSAGSNKGPNNAEYLKTVEARIVGFLKAHPYLQKSNIPAEMVTASGSGLDPNISPEGALIQVKRVARERKISEVEVNRLVKQNIETTLAGPPVINVLKLNVALNNIK